MIGQDGEPTGERPRRPRSPARGGPARHDEADSAVGDPWTDDRAPVEWITDRMIVEFAAGGGRFEEDPLPTAPDGELAGLFSTLPPMRRGVSIILGVLACAAAGLLAAAVVASPGLSQLPITTGTTTVITTTAPERPRRARRRPS